MDRERLKEVRQAIFEEERSFILPGDLEDYRHSIMDVVSFCGTPSCICGQASFLSFKNLPNRKDIPPGVKIDETKGWMATFENKSYDIATKYLDLSEHQAMDLFTPWFWYAKWSSSNEQEGFITKQHVLNTLDILIYGENDVETAWEKGKPND